MEASRKTSIDVELEDNKPSLPWSRPADAANLSLMSAVCFLHARSVYDVTGIPQVSVFIPRRKRKKVNIMLFSQTYSHSPIYNLSKIL
jgi:hypothetical protein